MCKTFNTIGSLTTLKSHLNNHKIYEFKSLKGVMDFQNSYTTYRKEIISQHEYLIKQEGKSLNTDLQQLSIEIVRQTQQSEQNLTHEIDKLKQQLSITEKIAPKNIFKRFEKSLRQWAYKREIIRKEEKFSIEVKSAVVNLLDIQQSKNTRYEFINSNFSDAVEHSSRHLLTEIERKKSVIDNLNSFIYGALGEQKVVKTLETLPDEYFLINDFSVSFSPAIYNKQENEYIKSVQIDHLLIAPSGIFIIETKNWSEKSLENLSLRSPVQQIKRASFVLFKLLNNEMSNHNLSLDKHHWGDKKIPIRNLIVLTNTKPREEFQYVKILTLNELLGYINYFKPVFSSFETQRIADFLLKINDYNTIETN